MHDVSVSDVGENTKVRKRNTGILGKAVHAIRQTSLCCPDSA